MVEGAFLLMGFLARRVVLSFLLRLSCDLLLPFFNLGFAGLRQVAKCSQPAFMRLSCSSAPCAPRLFTHTSGWRLFANSRCASFISLGDTPYEGTPAAYRPQSTLNKRRLYWNVHRHLQALTDKQFRLAPCIPSAG